jgi:hypothetical protein
MIDWKTIETELPQLQAVEGGYSNAERGLLSLPSGQTVFVKVGHHQNTAVWARKEVAVYDFLARHGYEHIPEILGTNQDNSGFCLEALLPSGGWDWSEDWHEARLQATLQAMDELAQIKPTLPADKELFGTPGVSQKENGWVVLADSDEKQALLAQKLSNLQAVATIEAIDIPNDTKRSLNYTFKQTELTHFDIRGDNCAWNNSTGEVKIVDWNWTHLGDRDIDLGAMFAHIERSGYIIPDDYIDKLNPQALHWLAGFWFNAATTPIFEGGPPHLRDVQLAAGIAALRLSRLLS